jgi:hypothetical protein
MTRDDFLAYARTHRLAVLASTAPDGSPQAAIVGVAVTDDLELIFDTLATSRKYANLKAEPRVAFVLGEGAQTLQYQGIAEELTGDALARCKPIYFAAWPDGPARESWPGIVYFRVRPTWLRHSDFSVEPARIEEMTIGVYGSSRRPEP